MERNPEMEVIAISITTIEKAGGAFVQRQPYLVMDIATERRCG